MMRMVRAETEREYEELWRELNKALLEEPSVSYSGSQKDKQDMTWSITPELLLVIGEKEQEVGHFDGRSPLVRAAIAVFQTKLPRYCSKEK